MYFHKKLVHDGCHVTTLILDPTAKNLPLGTLNIHLHNYRILGRQMQLLPHEPTYVDGIRRIVVPVGDPIAVYTDAAHHPFANATPFPHANRGVELALPIGTLVKKARHAFAEVAPDAGAFLESVHLCEVQRVHAEEPCQTGPKVVGAEVQQHAPPPPRQARAPGRKQPRQEVRPIFHVIGELEGVAAPEVVGVVNLLDDMASDWARRRFHCPLHLSPRRG
eukprot:TRINITY_DN27900_c0_g1_i1.p2 TRINITY_DN27900_c0_g1~~TRINITY_DN27900_c0_g1_i1.p2  ORF type:complete len:221 (+),score=-22.85 TRINITY_DN27900_c0_g1_i1:368-1030(+)